MVRVQERNVVSVDDEMAQQSIDPRPHVLACLVRQAREDAVLRQRCRMAATGTYEGSESSSLSSYLMRTCCSTALTIESIAVIRSRGSLVPASERNRSDTSSNEVVKDSSKRGCVSWDEAGEATRTMGVACREERRIRQYRCRPFERPHQPRRDALALLEHCTT